jgi:hypothetical protein
MARPRFYRRPAIYDNGIDWQNALSRLAEIQNDKGRLEAAFAGQSGDA